MWKFLLKEFHLSAVAEKMKREFIICTWDEKIKSLNELNWKLLFANENERKKVFKVEKIKMIYLLAMKFSPIYYDNP
jgi:hypothetical protein